MKNCEIGHLTSAGTARDTHPKLSAAPDAARASNGEHLAPVDAEETGKATSRHLGNPPGGTTEATLAR